MSADRIREEMARALALPEGRAKATLYESLAAQARESGDPGLEGEVLLGLSHAYEYSTERERLPVVFGRLLQLHDQFPAETAGLAHKIHWMLKWMTDGLTYNTSVPLATVYHWFDEFESRYRQRGFSPRPVHARRAMLALHLGDSALGTAQMEASIAAPRDRMADCQACEHNDWGESRILVGDDAGALEHWAPVIGGSLRCLEEPHRALARALLALLRTGRTDDARGAFLRGYPMVKGNISLMPSVGRHIEFCALTGNEARGLEILSEHAGWLAETGVDANARLSFITGVSVLLRRLSAMGHDALPAGKGAAGTVGSVLATLDGEIAELCARYDERNGTSAVSEETAARLAQQPLLDFLPLGVPVHLPASAPRSDSVRQAAAEATLDDLIAEARQLADARHPDSRKAWARVEARGEELGQDLPGDVAAHVARHSAGKLMQSDPGAGCTALLDSARLFAALGDLDGELEARATAALARELAGDHASAREMITPVSARAEAAFAAGTLTPRHYLNVRCTAHAMAVHQLDVAGQRAPEDVETLASGIEATLGAAEKLRQPHHVARCHDLLARPSFWRDDGAAMTAHLDAARDSYLAAGQPWFAARPAATLGQLALQDGDPKAAESFAREALTYGAEFSPTEAAQLSSLLAAALGNQPDKTAESADASLTAATRWDGISEPDTLHNTFNAARAYARLNRHGEAAALYAEAMPRVDVPYDASGVGMTREEFGRSLRSLGRHREAAEQFLEAARIVAADPSNQQAHAYLASAAAEELQSSGQRAAALAAFDRAAELFGTLGETVARVKCLRSAAWLRFWSGETSNSERTGLTAMRSVLSELESRMAADSSPSPELTTELDHTREQLDRMAKAAEADFDEEEE